MNRAKLGCTLNLRSAQGKELFKQLVAKSDVVVDNFSSGVLERLGFAYDVLHAIEELGGLGMAAARLHGNHAALGLSRFTDGNPLQDRLA
jgi:crotonobetainyl-CoA:carnitine CoA-transferase CaiB-like acyl-CoA transferase